MRWFLSTAKGLLDGVARALTNGRLLLCAALIVLVPSESLAFKQVVDSRYIEFTGFHYELWKRGATLPQNALCAPVGYLTMKGPPYFDAPHCFCADLSRFSEQPNLSGEAPQSVLFLALGDQDGDPVVCPWIRINAPLPPPPGNGTGAGATLPGSGSVMATGEVPPEQLQETGSCMSVSANNCQFTTGQQCADKNANNDPGGPWQWCGASPTNLCRNEYIDKPPFELHVCN